MAGGRTWLYIDTSELDGTVDQLKAVLEPEAFEKLMYRTLKEVGQRSRTPIKRAIQEEYEVTQKWVKGAMGKTRMSIDGGVQCIIPIDGVRGGIGTKRGSGIEFNGSGGRLRKGGGKALKLRAHIVTGETSILPDKMEHQGGQPPFMAGGVAYTRKTKARKPIARVVGLSVPQMPINRSETEVRSKIIEIAEKRLAHNFYQMFGK